MMPIRALVTGGWRKWSTMVNSPAGQAAMVAVAFQLGMHALTRLVQDLCDQMGEASTHLEGRLADLNRARMAAMVAPMAPVYPSREDVNPLGNGDVDQALTEVDAALSNVD